jgi:uncharacterized protein (TIGR02118 family)
MQAIAVYYRPSDDPDTFEKRYLEEHLPIVDTWPGVKERRFGKVATKVAGDFPYSHVFVALVETPEDVAAIMGSEGMKKAVGHAQEIAPNGFDAIVLDILG